MFPIRLRAGTATFNNGHNNVVGEYVKTKKQCFDSYYAFKLRYNGTHVKHLPKKVLDALDYGGLPNINCNL